METIDSKQEQLNPPEIIALSIEQMYQMEGIPKEALMLSVAREMSLENSDKTQIGNTVFLTHLKEKDGKTFGVGRAFNVDTAQNFISNGLKFFTYLQEKGLRQYLTYYQGASYDSAFKNFKRVADNAPLVQGGTRTEIVMRPNPKNKQTYVVITLGTEPLA